MKRRFRSDRKAAASAEYPLHLEGRRRFMQQLGLVVAGGAVASVQPGCDDLDSTRGMPDSSPAPVDGPSVKEMGGGDAIPAPRDMNSGGVPDAQPAVGDTGLGRDAATDGGLDGSRGE